MTREELMACEGFEFMLNWGHRPDSEYEGKYHHLKVQWQLLLTDREAMTAVISDALDLVSFEERRDFLAQMAWRILDGGDALERLLLAAFG